MKNSRYTVKIGFDVYEHKAVGNDVVTEHVIQSGIHYPGNVTYELMVAIEKILNRAQDDLVAIAESRGINAGKS